MKLFHLFILVALSGCEVGSRETVIMKCPVPGAVEKIQIVKIKDDNLYIRQGSWKPHPGTYRDRVWVSEYSTQRWRRTAIWDFAFHTYTVQYRPTEGANLTPNQASVNGTYQCKKIS